MRRSIAVEVDGEKRDLTVPFEAIERIESRISILDFLRSAARYNPKISDVAWVVYCVLSSNGDKRTYSQVGEYVVDNFGEASIIATEVSNNIFGAGPEKTDKKK